MHKLLLIDGNSIMNRAFFGIPLLTNQEGLYTNAVYGFLNIVLKAIEVEQATHLGVAFDLKAPTFRHTMFEGYKGNRKGMPDELRPQMSMIKEILVAMNIPIYEIEGFEADDVLGTLARLGEAADYEVTLLSGDRDMLQLATDKVKISIPKTKQGQTTIEHYYAQDVIELLGVTPTEFIDVKGLMGDTSDNIPGVPGIGEKTALKIISEHHDIDTALKHIDTLPKRAQSLIVEHQELARISKILATIKVDVPLEVSLSDTLIGNPYTKEAYEFFLRLGFKSLLNHFNQDTLNDGEEGALPEHLECQLKSLEVNELEAFRLEDKPYTVFAYGDSTLMGIVFTSDGKNLYNLDTQHLPVAVLKNFWESFGYHQHPFITHEFKLLMHLFEIEDNSPFMQVDFEKRLMDLSLMMYLLDPIRDSYDIDVISLIYSKQQVQSTNEFLGKGKSKKTWAEVDEKDRLGYLTKALVGLYHSYEPMIKSMEDENVFHLYEAIERPLIFVLYDMERMGIKIDAVQLKDYGEKLRVQIERLEKEIFEAAGEVFNIQSPKQLGVILFEKLGLKNGKKTKTGYSTAVDVLEKLKGEHPIIDSIMTYRQLTKLKSTYADGLFGYIQSDERIHSTFNQKIAATGRISSTDPNLQNIPIRMDIGREIRKCFIPKEGCVFIDADYSQIELRLLAHLSEDPVFVKGFCEDEDIHRLTASQVFHVPLDEVTDLMRRNAKAVNFGIVYGISAYGLSQDLNIMVKEANNYIENYFNKYPKVKDFLDKTVADAKALGYVTTMYDRKRPIPELASSNFMQRSFGERIAMNTPIQGSAADIIKIAMIKVYMALKERQLRSRLILQVHDELLIETYEDEVDEVRTLLVKEMEEAAALSVPLTVDAHIGSSWFDAK